MGLYALISDIHSNYEALTAVLEDIEQHDVDQVYCLGDVVGYGPNPCECIDVAMQCDVCILGNHDQGALFDPEGFNSGAERAIFWTRAQLENATDAQAEERWDFLGERPRSHRHGDFLFVHGSARNPLNEYVFPEDIYNPRKMERIFQLIDKYAFQGHTHVPGVFTEDLSFFSPADLNYSYKLDGSKAMVNIGSVGQPRDGDPRACYVLLDIDEGTLNFRRIQYDMDTTIEKIYAIPDLDKFLGDRLRVGR
ncbi:phosphodiesterase [Planctomycetes bacterium Pan216]|uniref:Phosphodiesterase n=1 Tax=Kolteria novifilia TaxID=2527975 RepID=A0A518BAL6_9BACT|nr:phosphodiesterase [Planctomycetes bacterium Pan216]